LSGTATNRAEIIMSKRTIRLAEGADPRAVLHTARAALEDGGYRWVPTGPGSAEAHQGGREITSKTMARHLLLGVALADGRLVLSPMSSGWGWVVPMGSLIAMRIRREFRRAVRSVRGALRDARLAS
jgi:hypothetical protein